MASVIPKCSEIKRERESFDEEYLTHLNYFLKFLKDLLNLTEADVRNLGLKNSAHRAKIISSLRILKEKYERGIYQTDKGNHYSNYLLIFHFHDITFGFFFKFLFKQVIASPGLYREVTVLLHSKQSYSPFQHILTDICMNIQSNIQKKSEVIECVIYHVETRK